MVHIFYHEIEYRAYNVVINAYTCFSIWVSSATLSDFNRHPYMCQLKYLCSENK